MNGYYIFVHVIFESSLASFKMVTARARTRSRFLFRSNYSSHLLTHIPFSLFFTMFKFSVYHIFFFKTCSTSNIFLPIIGNISRNTTQKSKLEYFTYIIARSHRVGVAAKSDLFLLILHIRIVIGSRFFIQTQLNPSSSLQIFKLQRT